MLTVQTIIRRRNIRCLICVCTVYSSMSVPILRIMAVQNYIPLQKGRLTRQTVRLIFGVCPVIDLWVCLSVRPWSIGENGQLLICSEYFNKFSHTDWQNNYLNIPSSDLQPFPYYHIFWPRFYLEQRQNGIRQALWLSEYCILNPLKQLTKWPLTSSLS